MFKKEKNNLTRKTALRKIKKQVKGITLIALVVTIIVILILAGIALNLTIGENGLFTRAQNAANTWQLAEQNEQNAMNDLSSWMDQYLNGGSQEDDQGPIKISLEIKGTKVTEPPKISGFTHVEGTEINTGYVIQDGDGNQFVWVPVDKNQKIKINVTSEANIDSISLKDPYGDEILKLDNSNNLGKEYNNEEVNPTINGIYVLTVTAGGKTKTKELNVTSLYALRIWQLDMLTEEVAKAMGYENLNEFLQDYFGPSTVEATKNMLCQAYKHGMYSNTDENKESVDTNGGFYIARYEASYQDKKPASKVSTSTRYDDSTPLTNGMLWNYIEYNDALSEAKAMYKSDDFKSSLPTGAAWDRTLGWLEETGVVTSFEIAVDSKTWGNYSDDNFTTGEELINTGYTDKDGKSSTEKNHIYDIAGNLREWTTEAEAITSPTTRGGDFYQPSAALPASSRFGYPSDEIRDHIGFRVALYL